MKKAALASLIAFLTAFGASTIARAEVRKPLTQYVFCWYVDYDPWFFCDDVDW